MPVATCVAVHEVHDVAAVRLDPDQAVALGQALLRVLDVRLHILDDILQIDIARHALVVDALEDHYLSGVVVARYLVHHLAVVVVASYPWGPAASCQAALQSQTSACSSRARGRLGAGAGRAAR